MGWNNKHSGDYSRYSVSLSTTNPQNSALLGRVKGKAVVSSVVQKISALIAVAMMMAVVFAGTIASAPAAKADMVQDIVNAFCVRPPMGYEASDKNIFKANTGGTGTKNATPYEVYGMSGTDWTVWEGFTAENEKISADDHRGEGSSRGIIDAIGGNSKDANLTQWEAQFKDKAMENPGIFNVTNECSMISGSRATSGAANFLLNTAEIATWLSGYAYQTAAEVSSGIYVSMAGPVEAVVTALKDRLYFAYLPPMIMIAALWMAYVGLVKRRSTEFLGGLVWTIAAVAVSVVFMTKPMLLPETLNNTVTGISQGGMAAITSYSNGYTPEVTLGHNKTKKADSGDKQNMCKVNKISGGEASSRTNIRSIQCNLWYAFVYTPWVIGQFGTNPQDLTEQEAKSPNGFQQRVSSDGGTVVYNGGGIDLKVLTKNETKNDYVGDDNALRLQMVKLGANKVQVPNSEQNWALYLLDHRSNHDNANEPDKQNKVREQLHVAANQLTGSNYNAEYKGENGDTRLAMGLMAVLASIGGGIMIITISVSLIILDIGVIILALISPLFFLAALHPGAGRRIAMGWLETLVKMALKRIALSIFLAVMVAIFSIMIQAAQDLEWAVAMILIVAIAIGGITYQKQVSEMFNGFSMGGQTMQQQNVPGSNAAKQMGRSMGRSTKNNALAAVTGGRLGGSSMVGQLARGKADDKKWDQRMGGGAGEAPQRGENGSFGGNGGTGGAGPAPTRKEQRRLDEEQAAKNLLERQGHLSGENSEQDTSGAGDEPQGRENGLPYDSERDDREGVENYEGGAGEKPMERLEEAEDELEEQGEQIEELEEKIEELQEELEEQLEGLQEEVEEGAGDTQNVNMVVDAPKNWREARAMDPRFQQKQERIAAVSGMPSAALNRAKGMRESFNEKRNNGRIERERIGITNESAERGVAHVGTRAEAIASLQKKHAEAKARSGQRFKAVNTLRRGTIAGARKIGSGVNMAVIEPSNEFKQMAQEFNKQYVAPRVAPRLQPHLERRAENRAMNNVLTSERKNIVANRKEDQVQLKVTRKAEIKDIRSMPKGVIRDVYAAERYGRDAKGNELPSRASQQAPAVKPTARIPAPQQQQAPPRQAPAVQPAPRQAPLQVPPRQQAPAAPRQQQQAPAVQPAPRQQQQVPPRQTPAPRQTPVTQPAPRQQQQVPPRQQAPAAPRQQQQVPPRQAPAVQPAPRQQQHVPSRQAPAVQPAPRQQVPPRQTPPAVGQQATPRATPPASRKATPNPTSGQPPITQRQVPPRRES